MLTWGYANGTISATLAVGHHLANDKGGVDFDAGAAAFLRRNIEAAIHLRDALNSAILLGAPPLGRSAPRR